MLTETDMIRIMAAKYSLAESAADDFIDNEALDIPDEDISSDYLCYDMIEINDFLE